MPDDGLLMNGIITLRCAVRLVSIDSNPFSDSVGAMPFARVPALELLCRAVLAFAMAIADLYKPAFADVLLTTFALFRVYAYMTYFPYFSLRCNQLQVAVSFGFAWTVFCLVLQHIRGAPQVRIVLVRCCFQHTQ